MTHEDAFRPLDSAIWEMGEAFVDFPDADLWTRPHPALLSVGELAAHVSGWEARYFLGEFESPFAPFVDQARYYPVTLEAPFRIEVSAAGLYEEIKRLHTLCRERFLADRPDLTALHPLRQDWTWAYTAEYTAFHIAYHTGQIYSVRHLLGHETADN